VLAKNYFPRAECLLKKLIFIFIFKCLYANQNLTFFNKHFYSIHMGLKVTIHNFKFWPSFKDFFNEHSARGENQNPSKSGPE
jgi:hypothetical protein